jgi:hypothetical protein
MKRLKKTLKWTGIVLGGLVAIGLVANAVFVWTTDTRLERQLAEIRAAGDPLTLADLARPPIPPDKNAATYLRRAEADVAAIQRELANVHSIWVYPLPLMTSEDRKAIKAAMEAYPAPIPLLERAAACPDYDSQLDYTLPPHEFNMKLLDVVQKTRSAILLLNARALLLVNEGNRDEAVRTGLVIFRLARHFDRNPTFVAFFPAFAFRDMAIEPANLALQTGPMSMGSREALDVELALQERMDGYGWAIKSHRAFELELVRMARNRNFWLIRRAVWNRRQSALLDESQALLALSHDSISYNQTSQTIHKIQTETSPVLGEGDSRLIGLPMQTTIEVVTRTRAEIRCLRVLNALQTHVSAGSKEPPKLTELGLPAETTTDPFTGEPLHVKKAPQGWLVYSVGPNFQDDGGKLDDPLGGDVGVGPPPPAAKPAKNDQLEQKGKSG